MITGKYCLSPHPDSPHIRWVMIAEINTYRTTDGYLVVGSGVASDGQGATVALP